MAEGDHSLTKYSKNGPTEKGIQYDDKEFKFSDDPSLEKIRELMSIFAKERNWNQYHTPRNILLALVGEVGELAEIFQWKGEVKEGLPDFTDKEKTHVAQEMSDVMLYLVRLADRCHIDLPTAVINKMEQNRQKYPADKVYGKSDKYTEYQ
ncbi:dCTP pyrophosphatase 1-like [Pecten maximus]|uniref:dCTP pyrophosphatase 1-like n=1 Tax=Pecten maximus TaxID=6579 RepID=UPI0014584E1B|nr:dCTP pyrophosphatase 1-like [Pecten maximus]XP_033743772.1 dCTP pyrophosphatase 1-like [Pecten maximus]